MFEFKWICYGLSCMLQFSQFVWALSCSVWDVVNNFLLIDATDRSKISSDQKRLFIALSLYPLSFFANTPFNVSYNTNFNVFRTKKCDVYSLCKCRACSEVGGGGGGITQHPSLLNYAIIFRSSFSLFQLIDKMFVFKIRIKKKIRVEVHGNKKKIIFYNSIKFLPNCVNILKQ